MKTKRILINACIAIMLSVCCTTTVQGQKIVKKFFSTLDKALNVNGQNTGTNRSTVSTASTESTEDKLIYDLEKINQQLIDVKLDENDLYKYPIPAGFYDYEVVKKYSPRPGEDRTTVRKYPGLTYTPELYEQAMEGDAVAQNKLGYCYLVGAGVGEDAKKASYFFIESAKNGMYESVITLQRANLPYDNALLKQIADKDYGPACYEYFLSHRADGQEYLMKAARLLYPAAYSQLAYLAFGKKLYKEALELYNRAIELGNNKHNPNYSPNEDRDLLTSQAYYYYHSDDVADNEKFFVLVRYYPRRRFESYEPVWAKNRNLAVGNKAEYWNLDVDALYQKLRSENKLTPNINLIYKFLRFPYLDEMEQYKFRKSLEAYAAENDNIYAWAELSGYYGNGVGVAAKDPEKSKHYLMKAADGGLICAARSMVEILDRDRKNNLELIYKYEAIINPNKAEENKRKAEEERIRKENMLKEMKAFVGTWRKDPGNWTLTFDEKGNVTITVTYTVEKRVKDPYFNFNKVIYDVTCTTVVECQTIYKVENGEIAFRDQAPCTLKSLRIDKPENPNEYLKEYVNKYGSALSPQPMLSTLSGKITFISPTEVKVEGREGSITLTKIK